MRRPGRARDALVALQVTGSVLLLICAAIFLRSSWAAATVDPGIRIAGIVNVNILNEQKRAAILEVVKSEPLVASVAASWPGGLGGRSRACRRCERQVDCHLSVRLAGVLRRPRHRSRARPRLHPDRAERQRRRGDRVRKRRAPAVAGSRRRRAGPAARAGPEQRCARSRTTRRFSRAASSSSASHGMWRASGSAAEDGGRGCLPADQRRSGQDVAVRCACMAMPSARVVRSSIG